MRLTSVLRRVSANHILAPAPTPPQKNLPMEAASNFYSGGESLASPAQPIIVVTVPPLRSLPFGTLLC